MELIEIIVITISVLVVASVVGIWIYKKVKHKPTGECACCQANTKKTIKKMRREMKKK